MEEIGNETLNTFNPMAFIVEGITDRDAPSLYDMRLDRTRAQLLSDKQELVDSSPVVSEGDHAIEEKAKKLFEDRLVLEHPEPLMRCVVQNQAMEFMRAIIDGVSFKNEFMVRVVIQDEKGHNAVQMQELKTDGGKVPLEYWVEIQHALVASGLSKCYFVSTRDGTEIKSTVVYSDPTFVAAHVAECIKFWDEVRRGDLSIIAVEKDAETLTVKEGNRERNRKNA